MSRKYKVFDWSKYYQNTTFRWAVVTWTKRSGNYAVCVCQQRSVARFLCTALNIKEARPTVRAKRPVQQPQAKIVRLLGRGIAHLKVGDYSLALSYLQEAEQLSAMR